jgi:hypothetical protein
MIPLFLLLTTLAADPPPLTAQQLDQVRTLVQRTQTEQAVARKSLLEAQEDLARCYADYELDQKRVGELQAEILGQQKRLLDTHHRMQTELRAIVGAERFQVLSRRIENALRSPPPEKNNSSPANK